jgi:pimeloyl-ACP methyl ester carboxylesterase
VLSHATGFHGRVWEPLARHLPGVDCHALDLRGHGDTPVPDGYDFPWPAFGDDVLAAVDALPPGSGRPVGVGHSAGGAALVYAEAARPGTFAALWLYEPAAFPPPPPGVTLSNPLIEPTKRRRATFPDRAAALANYASKPPMDEFDPRVLAAYVEHGFADDGDGVRLKCLPVNESRVYESSLVSRAFDAMARVRCPVLVVRGHEGTTGWWYRAAAARLPAGRAEAHEDLGHFGPLTHPARMAASISRWLGEI